MKKTVFLSCLLSAGAFLTSYAQDSSKIDALLRAYTNLHRFNGTALISRGGNIIIAKGYGYRDALQKKPNDSHTIFQIASVTKTFTSGVILKLVQLHKISLQDKLSRWYPGFPNAGKITVEQLLSHSSGIFDYTRKDTSIRLNTEQRMMAFLKAMPLDFEPGSAFLYSNSGYSILGFIIQRVTGMPYEQAVRKYIFGPLQMKHSGFDFEHLKNNQKSVGYSLLNDSVHTVAGFSDSSVVFAAGAIFSTVQDLYLWHRGLQNANLIHKELLVKAFTPVKGNYGFGWIIDSLEKKKMVYHSGNIAGFCSMLARIPKDDICIILLNNKEGTELEGIARQILQILYHRPYDIPGKKSIIVLSNTVLQQYTGRYEIPDIHLVLDITIENGVLMAHAINGPTFPLSAYSENHFLIQDGQADIEFIMGTGGKAEKLIINQNNQKKEGKRIE